MWCADFLPSLVPPLTFFDGGPAAPPKGRADRRAATHTEADKMAYALTLQDLFGSVGPYDGAPNLDDEDHAGDVVTALRVLESAVTTAAGRLPGVAESLVATSRMSLQAA